jgi:hypothetical protein
MKSYGALSSLIQQRVCVRNGESIRVFCQWLRRLLAIFIARQHASNWVYESCGNMVSVNGIWISRWYSSCYNESVVKQYWISLQKVVKKSMRLYFLVTTYIGVHSIWNDLLVFWTMEENCCFVGSKSIPIRRAHCWSIYIRNYLSNG